MVSAVIVGGHGKVALRLAGLLSKAGYPVTSVIRDASQSNDITEVGAKPKVLSLEDDSASEFTRLFETTKASVVYFAAGAGGKGGESRTKAVDYEGALKIYDAIEGVQEAKPFLVTISGVDVRPEDKVPAHYNEKDKEVSQRMRAAIPAWVKYKLLADTELSKRTAFKWAILRPGGLLDEPGTGKASVGRTHLYPQISRDDVAEALFHLATRPEAAGLGIDLVGGDTPIAEGLDAAIKRGESDFPY